MTESWRRVSEPRLFRSSALASPSRVTEAISHFVVSTRAHDSNTTIEANNFAFEHCEFRACFRDDKQEMDIVLYKCHHRLSCLPRAPDKTVCYQGYDFRVTRSEAPVYYLNS